jgi:uncharacterized membrane protein YbhN (UPF0104 family)
LVTWGFFSASLWVTIKPFVEELPPYTYVAGIYCLAYIVGFLSPFAPAGIGVRELILIQGLSAFISIDLCILLSLVNRLVYLFAEIILAAMGIFNEKASEKYSNY